MDLFKLNLFRGSLFKQAKFLFSTPLSAQTAYYIQEAGIVSKEVVPLHTGFMCPPVIKKAWIVLHSLKFQSYKMGVPIEEDTTLLISDRSYIPLDPNEIMSEEEMQRLTSLKDIARVSHAQARADAGGGSSGEKTDTPQLVIYISGILLGMLVLAFLILKSCGGGS